MLLHLDSSANRCGDSVTRRLGAAFARRWSHAHPHDRVVHRDLALDPVAPITTAYCTLGRRVERRAGRTPLPAIAALAGSAAEEDEWARTRPLIDELLAADTVLLGVPMYNFGVPAALKAWIDRVTFPGAFLDPDTGASRLAGTRVVVVSSRGGGYGSDATRHLDHVSGHLRDWLVRYGVRADDVEVIAAEFALAEIAPAMRDLRGSARESLDAAERAVERAADCSAGAGVPAAVAAFDVDREPERL